MRFIDYPINLLLAGLFVVAIVSFAVIIANNYGHEASYVTSDQVDVSGIEAQLETAQSQAESWKTAFTNDKFFVGLGEIVLFSLWGIIKLVFNSVTILFSLLFGGVINVLGVPAVVVGVLTTILIIGIIFSAWRMLKAGE